MRKLNRDSVVAPDRLVDPRKKAENDQFLRDLDQQYNGDIPRERFNSNKWRHNSVRDRIAEISHTQCVYCERQIHATNNRGQVEHFRPVAEYWWLAYTWENLLYACEKCNKKKLHRFPLNSPKAPDWGDLSQEKPMLINPVDEDPHDFLNYEFSETGDPGKIIPKNSRAKKRVEACEKHLGINRPVLKGLRRFELQKLRGVVASHQEWGGSYTDTLRDYTNPNIAEFTGMVILYLKSVNIDPSAL